MDLCTEKKIMDMEKRLVAKREGEGLGIWGQQMQIIAFGMDMQWDPAVQHWELRLVTCDGA